MHWPLLLVFAIFIHQNEAQFPEFNQSYLQWIKIYSHIRSRPGENFPGTEPAPESAGIVLEKVNQLIVGGTEATRGQWPWMVKIVMDGSVHCGGTLIKPCWVLTAGHCVYKFKFFDLYFGAHNISNVQAEEGSLVLSSKIKRLHPKYNHQLLTNDIALIKLQTKVQPNNYINFIRMPKRSDVKNNFVGVSTTTSGWGWTKDGGPVSNVLNYISDKLVIPNMECSKNYVNIVDSVLCIEGTKNQSICSGDSGGPLIYQEKDKKLTQIGIVSFGTKKSCYGFPQGFTRVTHFLSWISAQTGLKIEK
ncbi:brachyurin-like isoform X2 [Neocloeon triangulifer]|uniref:brachyurin-like isoform X2 n=1 Tax=Neocloeon triangulifer TaxID=2078957 RepID=UPI00286F2047|nr:brachyurin-like isoform X2 [Neocloeon triangulifer]